MPEATASEEAPDHQSTDHQSTDHQSTDHQSTGEEANSNTAASAGDAEALLAGANEPPTSQLSDSQRASFDACEQQAAPQQYGGPAFSDLQPDLALAACNQAWQQVPSKIATISAYIGRIVESQGQTEAAFWLYKRATADGLPVGYGLMAYRLMRLGEDDAKAAQIAETGHALGDWNAANVLATLYAQERIEGKGPADALALIEYVAEQGSPFAQYLTAWLYETHADDTLAALDWYERAVENGEDAAAAFLADLLERGLAQQGNENEGDDGGDTTVDADSSPDTAIPSDEDVERAAALYWQALKRGDSWAEQQFTQRGKERAPAILMDIQQRLAEAGFKVGTPDGIYGRKTERAIRALVSHAAKP